MLIGNVLEKTSAEFAWQLCADKLADRVRDIWLVNTKLGARKWEESFSEDPNALPGLRKEGFFWIKLYHTKTQIARRL